jgi:L-amino acid N-acyltransferase YncA
MQASQTLSIVPVGPAHLAGIATIENFEIEHGFAHFGEALVTQESLAKTIGSSWHPWAVAISEGMVVGFARSGPWKSREGYARTSEVGVYVAQEAQGRGVGKALYNDLLPHLEQAGVHHLVAGIALPNPGSVRLHESFGFQKTAHFPEMGFKLGEWRDVGYWTRLF